MERVAERSPTELAGFDSGIWEGKVPTHSGARRLDDWTELGQRRCLNVLDFNPDIRAA
jgi:hypothetical protein